MQVDGIDHVHVVVRDRDAAAAWYEHVLGLVRHPGLATWADDPMGPLILAVPGGSLALALFQRDPEPVSRDATIAFRVSGEAFGGFLGDLPDLGLDHMSGQPLSREDVVDHDLSWSVYLRDPDENRIEVTTYDYDLVPSHLNSNKSIQ